MGAFVASLLLASEGEDQAGDQDRKPSSVEMLEHQWISRVLFGYNLPVL